jgi:hypothetical protein
VVGHLRLEAVEDLDVGVEQVELVLGRSHRSLDPPKGVPADDALDPVEGEQDLLGGRREPLAHRGHLGRDVVAAPRHRQVPVLDRERAQATQRRDHAVPRQHEPGSDLELLHVLGEVPGGHGLVDVLVAGERAELLDARLDVVTGDPLAPLDRGQVDVVDDRVVGLDHAVGHLDPQVALGGQDRYPQSPLEHDAIAGREELDHRLAGIAPGQDVGDRLDHGVPR